MNDRDKLWAFLALLGAITVIVLTIIVCSKIGYGPVLPEGVFKLSDAAIGSFATVLGAAGMALFRISQATNDLASAVKTQAETASTSTPAATPAKTLEPGEKLVIGAAQPAPPTDNS